MTLKNGTATNFINAVTRKQKMHINYVNVNQLIKGVAKDTFIECSNTHKQPLLTLSSFKISTERVNRKDISANAKMKFFLSSSLCLTKDIIELTVLNFKDAISFDSDCLKLGLI